MGWALEAVWSFGGTGVGSAMLGLNVGSPPPSSWGRGPQHEQGTLIEHLLYPRLLADQ